MRETPVLPPVTALERQLDGIRPAGSARRRKSGNVILLRDMPRSNLPPVGHPWRSRGSLAVRRWRRSQARTFTFYNITAMTDNDKDTTGLPQDGRRTEYIGAKVTAEQKRHIRHLAGKCGMTVSDYLLARAFGYKPKERLTERQTAIMETLVGCRSDLVNYTSALRGMNPEKRRQMFGSYPFMLGWLKELGKLAERITGVLDRVRMDNRLPEGTRNDENREEEP